MHPSPHRRMGWRRIVIEITERDVIATSHPELFWRSILIIEQKYFHIIFKKFVLFDDAVTWTVAGKDAGGTCGRITTREDDDEDNEEVSSDMSMGLVMLASSSSSTSFVVVS